MEDNEVSKILFELSSNRRAILLFKISQQSLKMQQLANVLDMTTTETFRHLQRLSESKLVEKKADSSYVITPLGELAIVFLSSFNFILQNGNYFLEHPVSGLPHEFVNRLGELSKGEFCGEALSTFNRARKIVFEADEFIFVIAEQVDSSHVQATNEKVVKGLKFKFIMQKDLARNVKITPEVEHLKERRYLERIPVSLMTNEKEACILLRRANGEMDYLGFFGTDKNFRKWTQDLFMYYWERAERWYPNVQIE